MWHRRMHLGTKIITMQYTLYVTDYDIIVIHCNTKLDGEAPLMTDPPPLCPKKKEKK